MFIREIRMSPAYDGRPPSKGGLTEWRSPEMKPDDGTDKTNYGIGAVRITFYLKGPKGTIQFVLGTDWYPPHVQEERKGRGLESLYSDVRPEGWDIGYHSPVPMYEGQTSISDACEWTDGKPCYYDGSSLRADEMVERVFLKEGSDGVWRELEKEYTARFGGE